jgi:hypothetical protein
VSSTNVPGHRFVFVHHASAAPGPSVDTTIVVLDPAWTPAQGSRADVRPIRPVFGRVTAEHDLFDLALELVDAWGDGSDVADRLVVDDVTYWFRMREAMWRWTHERLLWRHSLAVLVASAGDLTFEIPAAETALRDVASGLGPVSVVEPATSGEPSDPPRPTSVSAGAGIRAFARRVLLRLSGTRRTVTPSPGRPPAGDRHLLSGRVQAMIDDPRPRVVVLTTPTTYQRVASATGPRDPVLGAVVDALERLGTAITLVAIGLDDRRDADMAIIAADQRMLPMTMFRTRWGGATDAARADSARASLSAAIGGLASCPFELDGVDLTAAFLDQLSHELLRIVDIDVPQQARIGRFLDELQPQAVLLAQEGIRLPWLIAAHERRVPVFAVQHGILYEGHPGYPHRRHPAVRRAHTTFVYGPYERDVLLRRGAYLPDEVSVVGSPRLDLDADDRKDAEAVPAPTAADERAAIRTSLGVRASDRMLVISTVNLPFVQAAHLAPMLERILGGPLPNVHLVFKLHPGERDDGPYRELIKGLAAAGGYDAPPVTVVRDVDLLRLLRAADGHLGLHSTVLTDAVAAGTMNLIAMTDAHADILGYVEAGVAIPIHSRAELLAALEAPVRADEATRRPFLERHLRPGPAGPRAAAEIVAAIDGGRDR